MAATALQQQEHANRSALDAADQRAFERLWLNFIFPESHEWFIICLHILTCALAVTGNCAAIVGTIGKLRSQLQTFTSTMDKLIIINLCSAELVRVLIWMPFTVVYQVTETWFFGTAVCKATYFVKDWSSFAFGFNLLASIFSGCQPAIFMAGTWTIPMLFSIYDTYYASTSKPEKTFSIVLFTKCLLEPGEKIFVLLNSLTILSLPAIVVLLASRGSECQNFKSFASSNRSESSGLSRKEKATKLAILSLLFFVTRAPSEALNVSKIIDKPSLKIHDEKLVSVLSMVFTWISGLGAVFTPLVLVGLPLKPSSRRALATQTSIEMVPITRQTTKERVGYRPETLSAKLSTSSQKNLSASSHRTLSAKSSGSSHKTLTSTSSSSSTASTLCAFDYSEQHSNIRQMLKATDSILEEEEEEIEDPTEIHQLVEFPPKTRKKERVQILAEVHKL